VLLKNHGVFTIGPTPAEAVKAAVTVEEVARITWLARQLGEPQEIPPDVVRALHQRYRDEYGQK
jgi:L-ribulose-5-phosphate 4-epimerase